MSSLPDRETARLRWGRFSHPGLTYFVTCCIHGRQKALAAPPILERTTSVLQALHDSGDIDLLAATLMPDHVHLLFTLGKRLRLGQVTAKLKTLSSNKGRELWHWQEEGFEHQLRKSDSAEDYAFYIFMNPYRAKLISNEERWLGWLCPNPDRFAFSRHVTIGEMIPEEWNQKSIQLRSSLVLR